MQWMKPLLFITNKFKNAFVSLKRHLITWKEIWLYSPVFGNAVQLIYVALRVKSSLVRTLLKWQ